MILRGPRCALLAALLAVGLPACGSDDAARRPRPHWVGFNDLSIGYRLATPEVDAALLARAGANVARVTFDWRAIEHARGRFDWRPYDALHAALERHDVRMLPVLAFAPEWTWPSGVTCRAAPWCAFPPAPAHDGDWARFATAVARRYPDAVAIEVWNEPNLHAFWSPAPDPARYTRLLTLAATATKPSAGRAVPVLVGGLATGPPAPGNVAADRFLVAVEAAGGGGAFDGVGVHLYPGAGGAAELGALLDPVRRVTAKPLWVTEVGVSTTGPEPVPEQAQGPVLAAIYRELDTTPGLAAVILHTLIDRPGPPQDREVGFGLVRAGGPPKPSFCVVGSALRGGHPPPGCPP